MLSNKTLQETTSLLNQAYSGKEGCGLLKDQIQEYYSYGHCMDLAIAFHQLYGFEIEAAIVDDKKDAWIGHAWVKKPNNVYLDIFGEYQDKAELESFGDRTVVKLAESDLLQYMQGRSVLDSDIDKAKIVARCLLKAIEIKHEHYHDWSAESGREA